MRNGAFEPLHDLPASIILFIQLGLKQRAVKCRTDRSNLSYCQIAWVRSSKRLRL